MDQSEIIEQLQQRVAELEARLDGFGEVAFSKLYIVDKEDRTRIQMEGGTIALLDEDENARVFISSNPVAITVLRPNGKPRMRMVDTNASLTLFDREGRPVSGFAKRSCYAQNFTLRDYPNGRLRAGMWVEQTDEGRIAFVSACDSKGRPVPGLACREDGVGGVFGNVADSQKLVDLPAAPRAMPKLTVLQGGLRDDDEDEDDAS